MRRPSAMIALALCCSAQARTMTYSHTATTVLSAPADFAGAALQGVVPAADGYTLAPGQKSGTLTGPPTAAAPFDELVPSWNARTPAGSSVTVEVRARKPGGDWTRYYSLGRWQSGEGRSSLNGQSDADGTLSTDTLSLKAKASGYQYRVTLQAGPGGGPTLSLLAFSTSEQARRAALLGQPGDRSAWGRVLDVAPRSQMPYPNGGEVWCSPTSTSMILKYWGIDVPVPQAAQATYDAAYQGTGNWPFNTAWAGSLGLRAFVARLPSLRAAEDYLRTGIPLAVSLGWRVGELPGAPIPSSSGHLMVLIGFDAAGNPVLNDPAAPTDATVRRSYPRAAFERLWLTHSGGTVYVIAPPDRALP
ncbi:peptidase C39 family protein [Deinococcus sonorensis]|uniref:Peptidase C39 family protein n=2 Tax=Deinococcus sonorensis TaxID=309891 RepID=A0AAU7UEH7_9DEIO